MKFYILLFIALLVVNISTSNAQQQALAQEITQFIDAKPIKRVPPQFPKSAVRKGLDGWVQLSFIVEPDGTTSNVIIEDSSGRDYFEKEAKKAIKQWRFQPAMENGKPVQQCKNTVQLDFSMARKRDGVSRKFHTLYRHFNDALAKKDEKQIAKLSERLSDYKIVTQQESYYKYAALADYAEYKGEKRQALKYLNKAYGFSGAYGLFQYKNKQQKKFDKYQIQKFQHLDTLLFPLLHKKLVIELDLGEIGDALKTNKRLLKLDSAKEYYPSFEKQKQALESLIESDKTLVTQGDIGKKDFWRYELLRNQFQFSAIKGQLTKLDVRCRNKRHLYNITEQSVWNIPEAWQGCSIYVYGENNSQFKLVELADKTEPEISNQQAE